MAQAISGWLVVRRFVRDMRRPESRDPPAITVLKPLHGDEPLLEQALNSVCVQDYPAPWQVVFGVGQPSDTALPLVRRLQLRFAGGDIAVVVDRTIHGPNHKVSNLINMLPVAKYDVVVITDSDVRVSPDWLRRLAAALAEPDVGLVTTIYTGLPVSPVATLGALQINHYFLPGALLARSMGRQDCLGATMALTRETLARIGGFASLVDHLADDNVLGRLVRRLGLKVALADTVTATTVPEATIGALWRHELRWARTIRALEPAQFAASVLQYPIAWAVLTVLLAGGATWSLAWFAAIWGLRGLVALATDGELCADPNRVGSGPAKRSPLWLLPIRELMSVGVMIASYTGRRVDWRGYTMEAKGFDPR